QHEQRADGRAHARLVAVQLGEPEHHVRRRLHRALDEPAGDARIFRRESLRQSRRGAEPLLDHAVDRLDGFLARDLAGSVTAHAVGDDIKTQRVVDENRVLVTLPLLTDVGRAERGGPPALTYRSYDTANFLPPRIRDGVAVLAARIGHRRRA